MPQSWIVLIPPLAVLLVGSITKRIKIALLTGIFSAAAIACNFSFSDTVKLSLLRIWNETGIGDLISWSGYFRNLYIFAFLIMVGILIALMTHSGGIPAYAAFLRRRIHSAAQAEQASLLLSCCFIIDDYFNSLAVGSIMHPLTDLFRIPRVKLAFLIDAMSAPLCILVPITSWVAIVTMQLENSGISTQLAQQPLIASDPFQVYLYTIPYIFYSFIVMASAYFIVRTRISYGLMHKHEEIAQNNGKLFGNKPALKHAISFPNNHRGSLWDFLFPTLSLAGTVIITLLITGDATILGGQRCLFQAITHADIFLSLFMGSLVATTLTACFLLFRKKISSGQLPQIMSEGLYLMFNTVAVLILAWAFSTLLKDDIQTGFYVAHKLMGTVPISLAPVILFLITAITSLITGSSWGTIAIMIPFAIPMLITLLDITIPTTIAQVPTLLPALGAIISGAVLGDHLSMLSDTTLMSSVSSGSYHADHINAQLPYLLPIGLATATAFLLVGFLSAYNPCIAIAISLGSGLILSFSILSICNRIRQQRLPH